MCDQELVERAMMCPHCGHAPHRAHAPCGARHTHGPLYGDKCTCDGTNPTRRRCTSRTTSTDSWQLTTSVADMTA
jgi:hypothetical protein